MPAAHSTVVRALSDMEEVVPIPMRLVEPVRPCSSSQLRRRLLPSLMRGGSVPKCEGFAVAEARVGNGAAGRLRRNSAVSFLPAPSLPNDCAEESDSSEGSCCSLCCSFSSEACASDYSVEGMNNEIEVRGPTSIAMTRPASSRAAGAPSKTALSPPVSGCNVCAVQGGGDVRGVSLVMVCVCRWYLQVDHWS